MELVLNCGTIVIPDCLVDIENKKQIENAEAQRAIFKQFNEFCKLNNLKPTPEAMKEFLSK